MHEWSLRRERLGHGDSGRTLFIFNHDRGRRGAGDLERVSRDGGDGLAKVANAVPREERLVGNADAMETRSIASSDDGANAGRRERLSQVEPHELCRGGFSAANCRMQHAGTAAIYGIKRAATQLVARVAARKVDGRAGWINHSAASSRPEARDASIAASTIRS